MELKEFVKKILVDVTSAVEEAKDLSGLAIAPSRVLFGDEWVMCKDPQRIEFDIALDVKNSEQRSASGNAEAEIFVANAKIDVDKKTSEEKNATHRIKFSVPIYFQAKSRRPKE